MHTYRAPPDRDFVASLATVIDPADVRWIWLTHPDRDHTGGLFTLLDAAPQARVVTTFAGAGIMSAERRARTTCFPACNPALYDREGFAGHANCAGNFGAVSAAHASFKVPGRVSAGYMTRASVVNKCE